MGLRRVEERVEEGGGTCWFCYEECKEAKAEGSASHGVSANTQEFI